MKSFIIVSRPNAGPAMASVFSDFSAARAVYRDANPTDGAVELWDSNRGRVKVKRHNATLAAPGGVEASPAPATPTSPAEPASEPQRKRGRPRGSKNKTDAAAPDPAPPAAPDPAPPAAEGVPGEPVTEDEFAR